MNRRHALLAGLATAATANQVAAASSFPKECEWLLGSWRSDVERSMANFTFEGKRPSEENAKKVSNLFGKITHVFQPTQFILIYKNGEAGYQEKSRLQIKGFTSSSTAIDLMDFRPRHQFTLFRDDEY